MKLFRVMQSHRPIRENCVDFCALNESLVDLQAKKLAEAGELVLRFTDVPGNAIFAAKLEPALPFCCGT